MTDDIKAPLQSEETEVDTQETEDISSEQTESQENDPKNTELRVKKALEQRDEYKQRLDETTKNFEKLQETIDQLRESIAEKREDNKGDVFTEEEEGALEKISKGLKTKGYMTVEDFEEMRRIDRRNSELNRLSDKYKKGSGYPEFRADEVLAYAKKNGYGDNLEAAYRNLHWDAMVQIAAKSAGGGNEPPESEKPTGGERTTATEATRKVISEMSPAEYEKNRETILTRFRDAVLGK